MKQKILLALGFILLASGAWATDYTLTLYADGCNEPNTVICPDGQQLSVSATPNRHFVMWNDGNTDNPRLVTMNQNRTYTAIFAINEEVVPEPSAPTKIKVYQDCARNGQDESQTSQAPANVEMVDLGLPSGIKWANMNVGATAPEEYGLYFAWGETQGYTGDINEGRSFDWASYKYCSNFECSGMTKYTSPDGQKSGIWYNNGNFVGDNKTTLDPEDDAAHVNWGGSWRMPTLAEQEELMDNCTVTRTDDYNGTGVAGRIFTSRSNGNSIFLPAAGLRIYTSLYTAGSSGCYWSSSLSTGYSYSASGFGFDSSTVSRSSSNRRNGLSVRPVCP